MAAAKPRKSMKLFPLEPVKAMKPTEGLPTATPLKPPTQPSATLGNVPSFKAAPGRPAWNVGQYLIKPTPETKTGFEMINDEPAVIGSVEDKFMKKWELPPPLQPKYLRKPEIMDQARAKNISKGFVKPRSRQG
jgi:hypothetical protein